MTRSLLPPIYWILAPLGFYLVFASLRDGYYTLPVLGVVLGVAFFIYAWWVRREITYAKKVGLYPRQEGLATLNDVRRLVEAGHPELAMRLYRAVQGGSIKDAKDAVDRMK